MLQGILYEASSASHDSPVLPKSHGSGVLETARYEANIPSTSHGTLEAVFVQCLDASMHIAENLEIRIVIAEDLIYKVHCVGTCMFMKLLAPRAVGTETNGKNAMWMKAKHRSTLLHVPKVTTKLAGCIIFMNAEVVEQVSDPWTSLKVPEPRDDA